MTDREAEAVGKIVGTADHGCPQCVGALAGRLIRAFPETTWQREWFNLTEEEWTDSIHNDA